MGSATKNDGLVVQDRNSTDDHLCFFGMVAKDLQLAIVLYRLCSSGENADIRKVATLFGVEDGKTIYKITRRDFRSILELQTTFITWPYVAERQDIVEKTYHELPHCIGYIDGTEIKLAETPMVNHTSYFSKKKVYSINAQFVCDYQMKIRHVAVGHFGSAHDARMFRTSALCIQENSLFSSEQWLAGDSAYPLLKTLIAPFRSNSQQLDYSKPFEA
ncbi:putative nuclease HARBI1 [Teleopsis dalmanni]|uniref:putative nuclease HARBI1 n=1 Tax=Teleopsis dalmanni TaxID=139649 RepID=UPI0018CFA30E|nr:putative nuclease HARBI1 [Teleopsis dalmanni]